MKILYIIGNGFDLNLGLKTSYKDFYEYYKSIDSSNENVNNLKRSISDNYKNWADLELALGQYTEALKTRDDFDVMFEDIRDHLAQYLSLEENNFDFRRVNREKFFENLVNPEHFLLTSEYLKIESYKSGFLNQHWNVDIVTFNYTTIIDRIIGEDKNVVIGSHSRERYRVLLSGVEHIHGFVDKQMVLGVNDISQLKNEKFQIDEDIIEAIVKEKCNNAHRHNIDVLFRKKIGQADLICIFGSSIGDTDNIWWEAIGNRLKRKPIPIIIFTKGEEVISPRNAYKNNRTEREIRNYFLSKTNLNDVERQGIKGNIYVVLDSSMFKGMVEIIKS